MITDSSLLRKTLFVDIETVSEAPDFQQLSSEWKALWALRCRQWSKVTGEVLSEADMAELYEQKAGIFAEFAKVVCISVAYLPFVKGEADSARITSFAGDDERQILASFSAMLEEHYHDPLSHHICGHNIREFDVPFLCRRMTKHRLALPSLLDISGKKPWHTNHILDTMDMWRFGDHKNYTSLSLLAAVMGIPSPKDDIDGSQVGQVYWGERNLERIVTYCQKDVLTVVQLMRAVACQPLLEERQVEWLPSR